VEPQLVKLSTPAKLQQQSPRSNQNTSRHDRGTELFLSQYYKAKEREQESWCTNSVDSHSSFTNLPRLQSRIKIAQIFFWWRNSVKTTMRMYQKLCSGNIFKTNFVTVVAWHLFFFLHFALFCLWLFSVLTNLWSYDYVQHKLNPNAETFALETRYTHTF
jgi:hypothetical protein